MAFKILDLEGLRTFYSKLKTKLSSYALDSMVVHSTGAETVEGAKTFSSPIAGSVTGSAGQVANALTLTVDSGSTEGTDRFTFNGSAAKAVNLASGTGIALSSAASGTVTVSGSAYQGATSESAGVAGLVPAAPAADAGKFLRGDGTWADAGGAVTGECSCNYVYVKKQWNLAMSVSDGDGDWISMIRVPPNIRPAETLTYTLNLRFGADGPGGVAVSNPYTSAMPANAAARTMEFYRDSTFWLGDETKHYIQTFSDGITMDIYLERDTSQSGYHNIKIGIYGPKASSVPRLIPLNVDGTDVILTQYISAGHTVDIPVSGTDIKIYPRPTPKTALWRNEFSEWTDGANPQPVALSTETPYDSPYLAYTVLRTSTGIQVTTDDYSIADWPIELSSVTLTLTSGGESTNINMNCLPAWVSTELQKVDEAVAAVDSKVDAIGVYQGATENESGVGGLVPAASSAQRSGFLRGDGTWVDLDLYNETVVAVSASDIDLSLGRTFTKTVSADTAFTISNAPSGKMTVFTLGLTNAGSYTVTWPATVSWNGGAAPALAEEGLSILTFTTLDGGTHWNVGMTFST